MTHPDSAIRRGLLVHAGALGDFVLATRVLLVLRAAGCRDVTVLGRESIAALAVDAGLAQRVLDLDAGGWHGLFAADCAALDAARSAELARIDLTINMLGVSPDDALHRSLARLTGGRVVDLNPRPRDDFAGHVSDQWLSDLADAGLPTDVGPPSLRPVAWTLTAGPSAAAVTRAAPRILLHPGSGGRRKCWPPERFVELAQRLQRDGGDVRSLLGPVERETWPAGDLRRVRAATPCDEPSSVRELARSLATTDLFVGNDSGATHLAAALDVATVAIFGPTDPRRWRPLGARVRVVANSDGSWPDVDAVQACTAVRRA